MIARAEAAARDSLASVRLYALPVPALVAALFVGLIVLFGIHRARSRPRAKHRAFKVRWRDDDRPRFR